jgi:hypothetical protein
MHEPLVLMLQEIHEDAQTGPVVPPRSNVRRGASIRGSGVVVNR